MNSVRVSVCWGGCNKRPQAWRTETMEVYSPSILAQFWRPESKGAFSRPEPRIQQGLPPGGSRETPCLACPASAAAGSRTGGRIPSSLSPWSRCPSFAYIHMSLPVSFAAHLQNPRPPGSLPQSPSHTCHVMRRVHVPGCGTWHRGGHSADRHRLWPTQNHQWASLHFLHQVRTLMSILHFQGISIWMLSPQWLKWMESYLTREVVFNRNSWHGFRFFKWKKSKTYFLSCTSGISGAQSSGGHWLPCAPWRTRKSLFVLLFRPARKTRTGLFCVVTQTHTRFSIYHWFSSLIAILVAAFFPSSVFLQMCQHTGPEWSIHTERSGISMAPFRVGFPIACFILKYENFPPI